MKKLRLILLLALSSSLLVPQLTKGQDWVKMMQDPKANVHDVQSAFYKWYDTHTGDESSDANKEKEDAYTLFKRWEYLMVARCGPGGNRPDPTALAKEYKEYLKTRDRKNSHTGASVANWKYVGNTSVPIYGGAGRINRIHFYPGNTNIIFATSPCGGLWKSIDGGTTWATNTDQLEEIGTGDMAINPLNPSIMYLGTGDNDAGGDFTPNTMGVLRSADGGVTWDTTGLSYTLPYASTNYMIINKLIFNPSDTGTLFAATSFGLFYSKDDGKSWSQPINDNIRDIMFEPFHSSTVYAGSNSGTFYRSTDSGKTFIKITSGLPASGVGRLAIGTSEADSNTVYVLAVNANTSAFYGLYRSTDRGQTFSARSQYYSGAPNLLGWSNTGSDSTGQAWYNLAILVSPTNRDSVFVAGSWLWLSTDGGNSWNFNNAVYDSVHIDIHSLTFYPGSSRQFILSSDGGVFKTLNAGKNWKNLSNNLAIAEQYSIGPSADKPNLWLTGWQDNGSSISSPFWQAVYWGDGMTCFIDYTNDNTLFASYQGGQFAASYDGGANWTAANNGITETGDWNTPWLQDPQQPVVLYSGFKNVWVSGDQGNSWSQISTWGSYYINALAVAPSNDQYIYASEYFNLYSSSNGGGTWNKITGTLPTSLAYMSGIAIDPGNPLHVWVTFSGWSSTAKVFKTTDGGVTWTNISNGLPNLPVNCIVYQAGTQDGIYVGTDLGVYYMDNTTGGWMLFNNGLPNVEVFDLKIYAPGNLLDAATYGRGTWQTHTLVDVGINNITSSNNNFRVYPNPGKGVFNVFCHSERSEESLQIKIFNVLGENILTETLHSAQGDNLINLSNQPSGVYFYRVIANNGNIMGEGKLVIQK